MRSKKVIVSVICLLLCAALTACSPVTVKVPVEVLYAFSGNGGTSAQGSTEAPVTPVTDAPATEAPVTDMPVSDVPGVSEAPATEAPSEQTPATEAPVTNAPVTEAPATEAPAPSGAPTTKEEIIKYYVTAYNKLATDAKSVTRTYDYTSNYKNILQINNNSTLEGIAKSLMGKFMVENKEAVAMTAKDIPPVGVTSLNITPAQVSSATCTDKGSYYEVVLKSTGTDANYEVDAQYGKGSAGVIGPLLRTEEVTGAVGNAITFEGLHSWYGTASVTAKIDKATSHITEFHFETPSVLHFDSVKAVVITVKNCNIGLLFTQDWKIGY